MCGHCSQKIRAQVSSTANCEDHCAGLCDTGQRPNGVSSWEKLTQQEPQSARMKHIPIIGSSIWDQRMSSWVIPESTCGGWMQHDLCLAWDFKMSVKNLNTFLKAWYCTLYVPSSFTTTPFGWHHRSYMNQMKKPGLPSFTQLCYAFSMVLLHTNCTINWCCQH